MPSGQLTPKQERFVAEYLIDLNATQAAIRAGYSVKTAQAIGSENLTKPLIAGAIQLRLGKSLQKAELTAERIDQELARIALSDIRKLYDENGNLLAPKDMGDDIAPAVAAIEVTEEFEGSGDERKSCGYTKKIKLWDKGRALELAMKRLNLISAAPTVNVNVTLEALIAASAKASADA